MPRRLKSATLPKPMVFIFGLCFIVNQPNGYQDLMSLQRSQQPRPLSTFPCSTILKFRLRAILVSFPHSTTFLQLPSPS
uniref:Secreted protein n=1 Tax=Panagrellus redivivus TaxID=6233 RepID=A0A7E4UUL0_PANRE